MSKRRLLTTCIIFIFSLSVTNAQRTCGTMVYLEAQKAADPIGFAKRMALIEAQVVEWKSKQVSLKKGKKVVITIPTVVHIVYNNSTENISDAQILSQIDVLNEDYRRLNADTSNTPGAFLSAAADCEIEFCLAQRDPSGNTTNGITRTSTSHGTFSWDDDVKYDSQGGKDAWPKNDYLNIWICNLGGGLLGYATPPGGPSATDGVVIGYNYFGRTGTLYPPYDKGRTTTHEVGHWLSLEHTWGDDGGSCSGSDNVSDTPNQASETYGCPSFPKTDACSPSSPGIMFMNYLDYTDDACMNLFTQGQKIRMVATLNGSRLSIQSSLGCVPVSAFNYDASISTIIEPNGSDCNQATINPVVTLNNIGSNTLTSIIINYDIDGGPNNTYSWTGSLATSATEDVSLPSITVSTGTHTFNASTSNPNGNTDEDPTNDANSSSFSSIAGTIVTLTLTLDDYGSENTWEILDSNSTVLYSGGPYSDGVDGTVITEEFCLNNGCYDFTIYDSYGDGMCCQEGNGSYLVEDDLFSILASGGADWGDPEDGDTTNFCLSSTVGFTPPDLADFHSPNSINLFPNPSSGIVNFKFLSDNQKDLSITIINLTGEIVSVASWHNASNEKQTIDLSGIANGIYFIHILTDDEAMVKKMVIFR
ncbi:MAG: T9SS type A sorting domain-containing protein [Bacteroidota bacterium]